MRRGIHTSKQDFEEYGEVLEEIKGNLEAVINSDICYKKAIGRAFIGYAENNLDNFNTDFEYCDDLKRGVREAGKEVVGKLFEAYGAENALPYINEYITSYMDGKSFEESLNNALTSEKVREAAEEDSRTENLTIGIEYEIATPDGTKISEDDFYDERLVFLDSYGRPLYKEEKSPETLEIVTDVNRGIISAVHEVDRRLELLENMKEGPEMTDDTTQYTGEYPGLHFHIGADSRKEARLIRDFAYSRLPILALLTADCEKEGYLSKRIVGNHLLEMDENHMEAIKTKSHDETYTTEYRIPDLTRNPERMETYLSLFTGIHGYYQRMVRNRGMSRRMETDPGAMHGQLKYVLSGEKEIGTKEMDSFLSDMAEGLKYKGVDPDDYYDRVLDLYRQKEKKVKKL